GSEVTDTVKSDDEVLSSVARYMHAKGVTLKCPMCGQTEQGWAVYQPKPYTPSIPTGAGGDFLIGGGAVETLATCCQNCGFIRMFDMSFFKKWEDENDGA